MNDVIRKERFGKTGETTDIQEHERDPLLSSDRPGAHAIAHQRSKLDVEIIEDESPNDEITPDSCLTSEANLGREEKAIRDGLLLLVSLRTPVEAVDDDHAAG
jgi:hypothetical protein